jgi:hypothetical protein
MVSCDNQHIHVFDPQYLPEGVERIQHERFLPNGENFQGAKILPPNWWIGMKNSELEIMIYDEGINEYNISIDHPGVTILELNKVANPNYLFIKVSINEDAKAGELDIVCSSDSDSKEFPFELKKRRADNYSEKRTIKPSDFVYQIMPDRFADGDSSINSFDNMRQVGVDRSKMYYRHGGNIRGILNNLDYIEKLGATAIWLTPVLENDMPYSSYHGYAITDYYNVDVRFGSNEDYLKLSDALHRKSLWDIQFFHPGYTRRRLDSSI